MSKDSKSGPNYATSRGGSFQSVAKRYAAGEKIAMLTAYDASMASLCYDEGVDALLVGDSLGHCIHGRDSTLGVRLEDICYHTRHVRQGAPGMWILADIPFLFSGASWDKLYDCSTALLASGANMVKLEGGAWLAPQVERLVRAGIPVCAHVGLWPQHVNTMGGYRVQGRQAEQAKQIEHDARTLADAGVSLVVVECVPSALGAHLTESLAVPTIGIGAGKECSGQILVSYDALGLTSGHQAKFVRCFSSPEHATPRKAIAAYCDAVRLQQFPSAEESYG